VFDLESMRAKTGIANRRLKPTLGIIDPNNTRTLPNRVAVASGFDQLCHALESYTAIPYDSRPLPARPILRPAYQGSNPISDVWSLKSLQMLAENLPLVVADPSNDHARAQVMLAATFAGIGFGNAGVHLCHGMSYSVSGLVRDFHPGEGYPSGKPIVPHGLSVVLNAPAVFRFTAEANPERHLQVAELMGADIRNARPEDSGRILSDKISELMQKLEVPNGLSALGYTRDDIPALVQGTLPQHRVTKLSPRPVGEEELAQLFENSLTVY